MWGFNKWRNQEDEDRVIPGLFSGTLAFRAFKSYYTSSRWISVNNGGEIEVYQMSEASAENNKKAVLIKTFIPGVSVWAFHATLNNDTSDSRNDKESTAFKIDPSLVNRRVIKREPRVTGYYGEELFMVSQYQPPMQGFPPFELQTCVIECVELIGSQKKLLGLPADSGLALLHCAVDSEDHRITTSLDYERNLMTLGYLCQKGEGGVNLHVCVHVDPCGDVPARGIDFLNAEEVHKLQRLKALIVKKGMYPAPQGWTPLTKQK